MSISSPSFWFRGIFSIPAYVWWHPRSSLGGGRLAGKGAIQSPLAPTVTVTPKETMNPYAEYRFVTVITKENRKTVTCNRAETGSSRTALNMFFLFLNAL
jgi:hypothetical protein